MSDKDSVAPSSTASLYSTEAAHPTFTVPGWNTAYFVHGEDAPAASAWLNEGRKGPGEAMIWAHSSLQTTAVYYQRAALAPSDADAIGPPTAIGYPTDTTVDPDEAQKREALLAEMIDEKSRIAELGAGKTWRWCGNFFSSDPYVGHSIADSACRLANQPPAQGPGEMMLFFTFNYRPPPYEFNLAVWLFY